MQKINTAPPSEPTNPENDLIWDAAEIGREINRTANQVYYLHRIGALQGAVRKVGHRTFIGSRSKLRALVSGI